MTKSAFSLNYEIDEMKQLVSQIDHRTLGLWARDCAERVLPYFNSAYPNDSRPDYAIEVLQTWIDTGEFSMATIRTASLDSHAAARDVGQDSPARSAARSAGQAVATAHVPTHSIGAANYALQARFRDAEPGAGDAAVAAERAWQLQRLSDLRNGVRS